MSDGVRVLGMAVLPDDSPSWLTDAVVAGGGVVVPANLARGIVWFGEGSRDLVRLLDTNPQIEWVQLSHAGIETYRDAIDDSRLWTCAKDAFSNTVAEHALALILATLRNFTSAARQKSWVRTTTRPLRGSRVLILGGGGIARRLSDLLEPFEVELTVLHRRPVDLGPAIRVVSPSALHDELGDADVVVVALPLTDETTRMIGLGEFSRMKRTSVLVNVARGAIVDASALEFAISEGLIAGAGLDVTDPEPLPSDSRLWAADNVLITGHSANSPATYREGLSVRIRENVSRFVAEEPLLGVVDTSSRH